jgi:uncharacterized membrane protein
MPSLISGAISSQVTSHSGPLPDPKTLSDYDTALPGLAERIVKLAEDEVKHRHDIDNEILKLHDNALRKDSEERRFGQLCGFGIGCISLIVSTIAIALHAETAAIVIGGTTVVGLVTVFVTGKWKGNNQDSKEEKP